MIKKWRRPETEPPIHFWHPHRGGGTTICRLAQAAFERTDGTRNCLFNARVDSNFNTPNVADNAMEDQWTCRAQLAFAAQTRRTFVSRETYLLAPAPGAAGIQVGGGQDGLLPPLFAPLCRGFHHITILRSPLSRIPADYCLDAPRWERPGGRGHVPWRRRGILALRDTHSDGSTAGFWDGARWSNYYVRCLLGREAFRRRALPPDALAAANATLHLFSVVVVLEHLDAQLPLLQHALGWPDRAIRDWRAAPRPNHLTPKGCGRKNWSAELESRFADVNRLDLALHGWWVGETERRLAALTPRAFGPPKMSSHAPRDAAMPSKGWRRKSNTRRVARDRFGRPRPARRGLTGSKSGVFQVSSI